MARALTLLGLVVALLLLVIFGVDLALGVPFGKPSLMMDVGFLVCGAVLAYLSFTTFRELA